jgi:hypothetical protein
MEHLNRSATARYIFNQPGVISAIPCIAFGLKGAAYSLAISEYGVVHDGLLQKATFSISIGSSEQADALFRRQARCKFKSDDGLLLQANCVGFAGCAVFGWWSCRYKAKWFRRTISPATACSKRRSCTSRGRSGHKTSAALPNKRSNSCVELFITGPRCSRAR